MAKKKDNNIITIGKRKTSLAKATLKKGKGNVKINGQPLGLLTPEMSRLKIMEPLILAQTNLKDVDIDVVVNGGGFNGQAEAVRLALGKALLSYSKSEKLEEEFLNYDRRLVVADIRRKESRKPNSLGRARAKRQKSYR